MRTRALTEHTATDWIKRTTEYLHKICTKDAAQIKHHAMDWWDYWEPDGQYAKFFARVDNLRNSCSQVQVFFSLHFEDHFNELLALARPRGLHPMFDLQRVELTHLSDFLRAHLLRDQQPAQPGARHVSKGAVVRADLDWSKHPDQHNVP